MELINNLNHCGHLSWQWMSSMFWQVSLFILIISFIDMFIRKWAWPQVRYALWILVLVKLVIPPTWELNTSVITNLRPKVEMRVISQIQSAMNEQNADEHLSQKLSPLNSSDNDEQIKSMPSLSTTIPERNKELSWQVWLLFIWITGMFFFLIMLGIRIRRLHQWHKEQDKQSIPQWFHKLLVDTASYFDLQSLPAIVFSDKAVTPAVYGVFHPVLLLPVNYFENLSREEAEHVILHELAHLKRGDLWLHGITMILQIIYWFNPLLIYVRKQMKHVREICCDLTVANVLREKTEQYRMTLLNTARELLTESLEPGLGLLGVFEEPFRLVSRLKWLEKKTWEFRRQALIASLMVTLLVVACFMPMSRKQSNPVYADPEKSQSAVIVHDSLDVFTGQGVQSSAFNIERTLKKHTAVLIQEGISAECFEEAVAQCREELQKQGIDYFGDPFGRFFSDPKKVPVEKQYWQAGFQIKHGCRVEPPLEILEIAPLQIASLRITNIKNTDKIWDQFLASLLKHNYLPCFPPATEIWQGSSYKKPIWQVTEMQIPVISLEDPSEQIDVTFKKRNSYTAIVLPARGSTGKAEDVLKRLQSYIKQKGITPQGHCFGEYYYNWAEMPPSEWQWVIGYPVAAGTVVKAPFETRFYDSPFVASAKFKSNTQFKNNMQTELAWSPFIYTIILNEKAPVGPAMEIYDLENGVTELQIPVTGEILEQQQAFFQASSSEKLTPDFDFNTRKQIISQVTEQLHAAMLAGDIEGQLEHYTDDAVLNLDMMPETTGKRAIRQQMIQDEKTGLQWKSFDIMILDAWYHEGNLYENGLYNCTLISGHQKNWSEGHGKYFRIWKIDHNAPPRIKYSLWNSNTPIQ